MKKWFAIPAVACVLASRAGMGAGRQTLRTGSPRARWPSRSERSLGPPLRDEHGRRRARRRVRRGDDGLQNDRARGRQHSDDAAGRRFFKNYDPTNFDATGHCNPMGYTRSMNAPVPTEIVQRSDVIVFLHESMFAFHVVYMDGRKHPTKEEALQTTWYGHSTGKWDGDTLVVDTVGPFFGTPKMLLDTAGHPMSEDLHLTERFKRLDADHLSYEVTVDDPKYYTKPSDQLQGVYANEAGTGNHGVRLHGEQQGSRRAPH